MKYLTCKEWWVAAGTRAIKTMAETALSLITVGSVASQVDWKMVMSASLVSGVYTILSCLAGLPEVEMPEEK